MNLPRFSVNQVVLVNLFFFVCLVAGCFSFLRTPVEYFPDISFNTTLVTTLWTGASAEEVERLVTSEIEDEIVDLTGIKELRSNSSADVSSISVQWDETLTEDEYQSGLNDLRAAVDRVRGLPDDAEEPLVRELSIGEVQPSIMIAVVDAAGIGEIPLLEVARQVKVRAERVPGVEKVIIRGEHERELRVLVDRDAAARHGLTVAEIADRIRRKNLNLPAGSFSAASGESTLRATGDYRSAEEILETIVVENPGGTPLRLADVASLEEGLEKRRFHSRYNGKPALVLGVVKHKDADIRVVSRRIREWIESSADLFPDGFELYPTYDSAEWVQGRLDTLWNNLWTGLIVVTAILCVTLGLRNAVLIVIAIPFSFLTAFILFPILDMTINSMTLIGLLLVSGMLVDDAIIVLENIYRRIEEGQEPRGAIVDGTTEVMWPVIAAVATTAAAFSPLLLLGGVAGEFMEILPKAVIVCLVASLLECLVVLPAHYLDLGSRGSPHALRVPEAARGAGRALASLRVGLANVHFAVDRWIDRLREVYLRSLDVVMQHRGAFLSLMSGVVLFAFVSVTHLRFDLFPSEFNTFFIALESPTEYGLDRTDGLMARVEKQLDPLLGETLVDYSTYVGNSLEGGGMSQRSGSNVAMVYAWITPTDEYLLYPENAVLRVQEVLDAHRADHPAGIVDLSAVLPRNGPPIGKPVAVQIRSDDYAQSKAISREMQAYLRSLSGVINVEDNLKEGTREVRMVLDDERAARHGLTFQDLARALRSANDGIVASSFRDPGAGEAVDIRVILEPRFRREVADLLQTKLPARDGYLVKLGEVADVEVSRSFLSLTHIEGRRSVTVYADVDGQQATSLETNRALATRFADLAVRYPEVEVLYGGEFQATAETFSGMAAIVPVALLMIYMILAAVFRSYLQPLVVSTAIPLGIVGVIFGVALMGYSVSMTMLYATVGMMGVAVNDALVMVDFVNKDRASGTPLLEAVRRAGAVRLRPILLTTLTTAGALMPMALGLQGSSKTYGPLASAIVFGLMFAMVGTLYVVPLAYTSLIHAQEALAASGARFRARLGFASAEPRALRE